MSGVRTLLYNVALYYAFSKHVYMLADLKLMSHASISPDKQSMCFKGANRVIRTGSSLSKFAYYIYALLKSNFTDLV